MNQITVEDKVIVVINLSWIIIFYHKTRETTHDRQSHLEKKYVNIRMEE